MKKIVIVGVRMSAILVGLMTTTSCVKSLTTHNLVDASLVPSSRPLPDQYSIDPAMRSTRACDADGPVRLQSLLAKLQGEADAVAQVTIQREVDQTFAVVMTFGKVREATLLRETTCIEVTGYPVEFSW